LSAVHAGCELLGQADEWYYCQQKIFGSLLRIEAADEEHDGAVWVEASAAFDVFSKKVQDLETLVVTSAPNTLAEEVVDGARDAAFHFAEQRDSCLEKLDGLVAEIGDSLACSSLPWLGLVASIQTRLSRAPELERQAAALDEELKSAVANRDALDADLKHTRESLVAAQTRLAASLRKAEHATVLEARVEEQAQQCRYFQSKTEGLEAHVGQLQKTEKDAVRRHAEVRQELDSLRHEAQQQEQERKRSGGAEASMFEVAALRNTAEKYRRELFAHRLNLGKPVVESLPTTSDASALATLANKFQNIEAMVLLDCATTKLVQLGELAPNLAAVPDGQHALRSLCAEVASQKSAAMQKFVSPHASALGTQMTQLGLLVDKACMGPPVATVDVGSPGCGTRLHIQAKWPDFAHLHHSLV